MKKTREPKKKKKNIYNKLIIPQETEESLKKKERKDKIPLSMQAGKVECLCAALIIYVLVGKRVTS